jgi:nitronate monooxygenase
LFKVNKLNISGASVYPIIEGGKGINISTGLTAGSFAKAGAVGTISATNPDFYDNAGNVMRYVFDEAMTRKEKFIRLVEYSIKGAIDQIKIANDVACGNGRIHINLLWEAGGTKHILDEVLSKVKGLVHGVTAGAGLPYKLSDFAQKYNVYYYPIISSARAFQVLWKRAYSKASDLLGGVVYEDPWLAGGHNGLSNQENPLHPQDPYLRLVEVRKAMDEYNLQHVPIIIAGGVWSLSDWGKYIDNKEIGLVAFQFGTRPLLTKESPISDAWKQKLVNLKEGDIALHKFSPTGFYSSAIKNPFLMELYERNARQLEVNRSFTEEFNKEIPSGNGVSVFYVKEKDYEKAADYINAGFSTIMRTPEGTAVFVTRERAESIKADQAGCMGCLSACRFSGWEEITGSTGILPDPRSFCIEKTLQDVGHGGSIEDNLLFSGHNAYKFGKDPLYSNGNIPTIAELVDIILKGK